jgi:hypothetical protein
MTMEIPTPLKPEGQAALRISDLLSGVELIKAERQRQISVEGWTPEHDDTHDKGELLEASNGYILAAVRCMHHEFYRIEDRTPPGWPFDKTWWKPSRDAIRNLVKAAALIAAEIDRLQRVRGSKPDNAPAHRPAQETENL